jgi:ATP-dependent protease HslVU (ClpYQ) ATPase subunit
LKTRRRHDFHAHRRGREVDLNLFVVQLAFTQFFAERAEEMAEERILDVLIPPAKNNWGQAEQQAEPSAGGISTSRIRSSAISSAR